MTTPLQQFRLRWAEGCGNAICSRARHICLCRGTIPCDVLLIGEAPGVSEDVVGYPFAGPAGAELDKWLSRAIPRGEQGEALLTFAYSNVVCCIPRDEEGNKASEPSHEEIGKCRQRLVDFVKLCDGDKGAIKLLVLVGNLARDYTDPKLKAAAKFHRPLTRVEVTHPAAVLRIPTGQRSIVAQRQIVKLATAMSEVVALDPQPHP